MAYKRDIPAASDILSTSQDEIKTNFNTADTSFAINHVAFSESTNAGKHKYCSFIEQSSAPSTAANEVALYTKETSSIAALFMRNESDGTEVQLSVAASNLSASAAGSSYLPGGVIIKWGSGTASTSGTALTFGTAFPNNCWSVIATTNANESAANSINILSVTKTGFTARDANGWGYYYIAIGN